MSKNKFSNFQIDRFNDGKCGGRLYDNGIATTFTTQNNTKFKFFITFLYTRYSIDDVIVFLKKNINIGTLTKENGEYNDLIFYFIIEKEYDDDPFFDDDFGVTIDTVYLKSGTILDEKFKIRDINFVNIFNKLFTIKLANRTELTLISKIVSEF